MIPQIDIRQLETSGKTQQYMASFEGRYFEVNEAVARLITVMQESETLAEVSQKYRGTNGKQYSEDELEKIVEKCITPILNASETPVKHPFFFKLELLSQSAIEKFSNVMKILFHKYVIAALLLCAVGMEIYFIVSSTMLVSFGDMNLYVIFGVVVFMLGSSFIHELGHASACRHFKVEHGGVGFGLYLTFPVFYTDVSETWKLKRKERIVVNMAGVYFQLILLIPLFVIFFVTQNYIIKWIILTVDFSLLVTLNPFFKFDGYWIVSDWLGVPNLRKRSGELIGYFFNKLFRQKPKITPYLLSMKKNEKTALIVYTVIVNLFFGFYFVFLLPMFLYRFFITFPPLIEQLIYQLSSGQTIGFGLIQAVFGQLLFFALICYLLVRVLKPVFFVRFKNSKHEQHGAEQQ
jgi:putative peptide zinc metalloprotease protein